MKPSYITREFNSPTNSLRTPYVRVEPYGGGCYGEQQAGGQCNVYLRGHSREYCLRLRLHLRALACWPCHPRMYQGTAPSYAHAAKASQCRIRILCDFNSGLQLPGGI
eukprot:8759706-Pyramimonas_sp.AAC.1